MQTDQRRHRPRRPAREEYIAAFEGLRASRNTNYSALARRAGMAVQKVSAAAKGHQAGKPDLLVTQETVEVLDRLLGADGSLVERWQYAAMEDTAIRIGLPAVGLTPVGPGTVSVGREVGATDRRELLGSGLTAAAVLAATGDVGAQLDQAQPPTMELADCRTTLATLDRNLWSRPPADLFPPAFEAWQTIETVLARRVHPGYTRQLVLLAGQLAASLSTVARFAGDAVLAARFAAIAERHADAVSDQLLTGRVAGIQTCVAFNDSQYDHAADVAASARPRAHAAQRARLSAYEAQAAAAAGDPHRAEQAIIEMRAAMPAAAAGPALTWNDAEEDLYTAIAYSHLPGQSRAAITHGMRAAAAFRDDKQGIGLAYVAVARGHLRRERPDLDAAAEAGLNAVAVLDECPNAVVADRIRLHLLIPLTRVARDEPAVRELASRVASI